MPTKLHQITANGLEELKKEKEHIISVEIEDNKRAIQEARAMGDLSENAEYSAAKEEQTKLNARLAEIEEILKYHEIIAEEWYTVRIEGTDADREYQLVGITEADPLSGKISRESPLGKALNGRKVNDVITYTSGSGKKLTVKIIKKGK